MAVRAVVGAVLLFVTMLIMVVFVGMLFGILIGLNVVVVLLIVFSVKSFSIVSFDCVVLRRLTVVTGSEVESVIFPVVGKVVVCICVVFVISNDVVLSAGLTVVLNSDVLLEVSVVLMLRLTSVSLKLVTFNGISVVLNKFVFIVKAVVFDCVVLNRVSVMLELVTSGKNVVLNVVKLSVYIVLTCGVFVVVSVLLSVVSKVDLFKSCVVSYRMAVVLNSV